MHVPQQGNMAGNWTRPPDGMPRRNEVEGFAIRTRKNLDFILAAHEEHADVHVVTQLVELEAEGWPSWNYLDGSEPPTELSHLMAHLRHAVAHSNISFSSESRYLDGVTITFMNRIPKGGGEWRASIRGDDLLTTNSPDFAHAFRYERGLLASGALNRCGD